MKTVIYFLIATLACTTVRAAPFLLVTEDEVALEAATLEPQPSRMRSLVSPDAPKIKVISPEPVKDVFPSPLSIELKFISAGDADIDPASFRANYGFLRLDVTNRITQSGKLTKYGLSIAEANIPKGSHHLILQVSDTKGRVGESDLKFRIE